MQESKIDFQIYMEMQNYVISKTALREKNKFIKLTLPFITYYEVTTIKMCDNGINSNK